jgi:predicted DNA-binding ribbon-helix-helix protein
VTRAKGLKRSLTIAGHRTSLSLEPEFWAALQEVARAEGKSLAALVATIDAGRGERNLSSALRVWILNRLRNRPFSGFGRGV